MQKIEHDVIVTIEELGAQAIVVIPPLELNDIMRERNEYLAQTAADLYDRVVYMVRKEGLEYDPEFDENDEGPLVTLTVTMSVFSMSTAFWLEERRQRQDKLRKSIVELMNGVLNMKKNLDDIIREESESERE